MIKVQELLIFNMKKARDRARISQMDLAEKTDLSSGFIGDIEAGKRFPSARSLQKISDALELEPFELFLDTNTTSIPCSYETIHHVKEDLLNQCENIVNQSFRKHFKNG